MGKKPEDQAEDVYKVEVFRRCPRLSFEWHRKSSGGNPLEFYGEAGLIITLLGEFCEKTPQKEDSQALSCKHLEFGAVVFYLH